MASPAMPTLLSHERQTRRDRAGPPERRLDEALQETFPASDPVAIQHIGGTVALTPNLARQRLARRRLRGLVDKHRQLERP